MIVLQLFMVVMCVLAAAACLALFGVFTWLLIGSLEAVQAYPKGSWIRRCYRRDSWLHFVVMLVFALATSALIFSALHIAGQNW